MASTKSGQYRFVVKDHPNGGYFLVLENAGDSLDYLEKGMLSFDLRDGFDYAR